MAVQVVISTTRVPVTTKPDSLQKLPVIGWREWVALPDLACDRIKVKVDTGARSSALHAFNIVEFEKDGENWVRFDIHPRQRQKEPVITTEAKVLEHRLVKSSNGKTTRRPVIITNVKWQSMTWRIELTLANRDAMGFRMLLGRQAVRGKMLVDPGGAFYGGKPARRKKKPTPKN